MYSDKHIIFIKQIEQSLHELFFSFFVNIFPFPKFFDSWTLSEAQRQVSPGAAHFTWFSINTGCYTDHRSIFILFIGFIRLKNILHK